MIEYSTDLSKKLYDVEALEQKIRLRVSMMKGSIPHCDLGLVPFLFTYEDGSIAIKDALKDLNITNIEFVRGESNMRVNNIDIDISKGAV